MSALVLLAILCRAGLEVSDEVVALALLLEAREDHLGAGNVLLGVLEVLEEGLLTPFNAL